MYLTFFGFREKPFNLTPDPKFLYLNASYREALASLRFGIYERKGDVVTAATVRAFLDDAQRAD